MKKTESTPKLKAHPPELTNPGKTKGCLFGPPGAGKTWFAMSFPAPYYIDTEGGGDLRHYQERLKNAGGAYLGPEDGANDFEMIVQQMQALATETHAYKTLIIDSITKPFQTSILAEQERLGDKDAFGASKKAPIQQMRRVVNWAMRLDMNIWFVAHEAGIWGNINGTRTEIGRGPDAWEKLAYELDLCLHIKKIGPNRMATVWKSRLLGFPDAESFVLQDNGSDVGYANFAERYGKDYIEAAATPIILATIEQVAEIKRLIDVVKVTEQEVEKVLTRANADDWSELNETQAQATIAWLQKKVSGK